MPPREADRLGAADPRSAGPSARCAFVLPAELAAAWAARSRVRAWLTAHRFPEPFVDDLEYLVSEAVSNSAEHAYPDGEGTVEVVAELVASDPGRQQVEVAVRDRGRWRPADPDPGHRGHGIAAMVALTQELTIRRRPAPGGTELVLLTPAVPGPVAVPLPG